MNNDCVSISLGSLPDELQAGKCYELGNDPENSNKEILSNLFPVGNSGGIRYSRPKKDSPIPFVLLTTSEASSSKHETWSDNLDGDILTYFGDGKDKNGLNASGNKICREVLCAIFERNTDNIPSFLYFEKRDIGYFFHGVFLPLGNFIEVFSSTDGSLNYKMFFKRALEKVQLEDFDKDGKNKKITKKPDDWSSLVKKICFDSASTHSSSYSTYDKKITLTQVINLSKPFLLLAGISGTGKSRFVREQAKRSSGEDAPSNYELISVRPDWHEPSDLLGYVSRLGENAPHFVSTPTLKFMVSAWKNINPTEEELIANHFEDKNVLPYWLCLDEMNLAPVEQYFADYLSVIETRDWTDGCYRCDPILKADVIKGLSDEGRITLKKDLGLETGFDALWDYFCSKGVPIPYNLIVAGTVNMDETTHGFSRKVIDRALTVDFGEFFPNDFDAFFDGSQKQPIVLSYPTESEAREETDAAVKSRQFLQDLNESALKGTAFEVAFRALNELLLSVQSFASYSGDDSTKLQAVWDDFLMMKILPRIEGDREKVAEVLNKLETLLATQLVTIWFDDAKRPDLWRYTDDLIPCRSKVKIKWMQDRLEKSGFTSFWP